MAVFAFLAFEQAMKSLSWDHLLLASPSVHPSLCAQPVVVLRIFHPIWPFALTNIKSDPI
jgi:hypothetical protein